MLDQDVTSRSVYITVATISNHSFPVVHCTLPVLAVLLVVMVVVMITITDALLMREDYGFRDT